MDPTVDQVRQRAHALPDLLPAEKLNAIRRLLEVMVGPIGRSRALAPEEKDEVTAQTAAAIEIARASLARGEGILHQSVLREFRLL